MPALPRVSLLWLLAALPFLPQLTAATVWRPALDTDVIATVRPGPLTAADKELRNLRQTLAADPARLELALDVAQRALNRGKREADPRFLGQAELALSPWKTATDVPVSLRVLRANLRQTLHDFPAALADLNQVLKEDPRHVQAWLMKATLHTVQGDYALARAAAAQLLGKADPLVTTAAIAQIAVVTGNAESACRQLQRALDQEFPRSALSEDPSRTPIRVWAITLLAESLARLGNSTDAEHRFQEALTLDQADPYLLAAYSDFLLAQNRPAEVVTLLDSHRRQDGLKLRWAEAQHRASGRIPDSEVTALAEQFAAAQARGERVHLREEARFELRLRNQAASALVLARENWRVQKEPADFLLLREAALAVQDEPTLRELQEWQTRSGFVPLPPISPQL